MDKITKNNCNTQKDYIPENLDLDMILNQYPSSFKSDKGHFSYILHLVTEIPAYKKELLESRGFVPINAQTLQNHIHNYKDYLDYLVNVGIFEPDRHYIKSKKSKGYRFTRQYQTKNKEEKALFRPKYYHRHSKKGDSKHLYPELASFFNEKLNIDFQAAEDYLQKKLEKDLAAQEEAAYFKFNAAKLNIIRLRDHQFYFRVDKTSGRLHTNLTNLPKAIRNFITYDGKPLVAADFTNSQPFLSILLFNQRFYEKESKSQFPFNIFNILPSNPTYSISLHKLLPSIMLVLGEESLGNQGESDVERYCRISAEGKFYECLQNELFKATRINYEDRRKVKEMVFSVLFSGNQFIGQPDAEPKRIFRDLFPTVFEVFRLIKKHLKNLLAILLQTIEAKLILDNIAKRICQELPDVPIFTIHDSIVFPVGQEEYVNKIIQEETFRCIGVLPSLKFEYWRPNLILESRIEQFEQNLSPLFSEIGKTEGVSNEKCLIMC